MAQNLLQLLIATAVVAAATASTTTVLEFERDLNTCDPNDYEITEGTNKVLYAFGGETLGYHGNTRGSKTQLLRGKTEASVPANGKAYTIRAPSIQVPEQGYDNPTTSYMCFAHDIDIEGDFNMIGYEPVIAKGHETNFHHVLIYDCGAMSDEEFGVLENGIHCSHENMPTSALACQAAPLLAWATGGGLSLFPEQVSLLTHKRILFEIHYDNPQQKAFTDDSGMILHYVEDARENAGALLAFGYAVHESMVIPAAEPAYTVTGYCSGLQTREFIPEEGITVFMWGQHTHTIGYSVKTRHFRPTNPDCVPTAQAPCPLKELKPIADAPNYDFNFQEATFMHEEIKILPGDEFWVECKYNSQGRDTNTIGGDGTEDEMCLSFLGYYPKIDNFGYCMSMYMDVEPMMKQTGPPTPKTYAEFGQHMQEESAKESPDYHVVPMGLTIYNNAAPVYAAFFHPPMAAAIDASLIDFYTAPDPCNERRGLRAQADDTKTIRQLEGDEFDKSGYDHTMPMDADGKVHFHWHVDEGAGRIRCALEVSDHDGYVAVGFNNHGGMAGADIIVGEPGSDSVKDMYRAANSGNGVPIADGTDSLANTKAGTHEEADVATPTTPTPDVKPDAPVATEAPKVPKATTTILEFERDLNTCDEHDSIITEGMTKVLYAFGGEALGYHSGNRGSKSQILRGKSVREIPENAKSYTVKAPNIQIPEVGYDNPTTSYMCFSHDINIHGGFNMVGYEPVVEKGHEANFHHVLVYDCGGMTDEQFKLLENGMHCDHENMPTNVLACQAAPLIAWAIGGGLSLFPQHVSLPTHKRLLFEVHYDNPQQKVFTDNSGITLYHVEDKHKRENDGAVLAFGYAVHESMSIPPKQESYTVTGYCSGLQTREFIPEEGINVFMWGQHTHLIGFSVSTRHFRPINPDCVPTAQAPCPLKELKPLADAPNYDFNFQEYTFMHEEIKILPGDEFWVECTYNSNSRDADTIGGEGTEDEMCLSFLGYYPKIDNFGYCLSMYMDVEPMMKQTGPPTPKTYAEFGQHMQEESAKESPDYHVVPMGVTVYNNKSPVYAAFFHPPMAAAIDASLIDFYTAPDPCDERRGLRAQDDDIKTIRQLEGDGFDKSGYDHTMPMDADGKVHFHWHVNEEKGRIRCALEVSDHDGYVAVGFNNHGGMAGADIIVGEPGSDSVKDMYRAANSGNGAPIADSTDNLGSTSAGKYHIYPSPSPSPADPKKKREIAVEDRFEIVGTVTMSDLSAKEEGIKSAICDSILEAEDSITKCSVTDFKLVKGTRRLSTTNARHLSELSVWAEYKLLLEVKFSADKGHANNKFDLDKSTDQVAAAMMSAVTSGALESKLKEETGLPNLETMQMSYSKITSSDVKCSDCDSDSEDGVNLGLVVGIVVVMAFIIVVGVCLVIRSVGRKAGRADSTTAGATEVEFQK